MTKCNKLELELIFSTYRIKRRYKENPCLILYILIPLIHLPGIPSNPKKYWRTKTGYTNTYGCYKLIHVFNISKFIHKKNSVFVDFLVEGKHGVWCIVYYMTFQKESGLLQRLWCANVLFNFVEYTSISFSRYQPKTIWLLIVGQS